MKFAILLIFLNAGDKKLQNRTINSEKGWTNQIPVAKNRFLTENLKIVSHFL